ncbi:MAG: phosphotransferase [Butyrivibrio sp.]|nr:phosphotransferase [Butyrivibrio sp.]
MAEKKTLTRLAGTLHPADYFIFGNLRLDNILVRDGKLYIKDLTRCGRGNPVLDLQMAASAMNADGHGAFWTRLFARYTEGFTQEFRTRLEHELQPQIGPWW